MTMFTDFSLSKEMIKAIQDMGFETPSPIQSQTIPLLLENKDLIGQAQTGTGKTAAFGIPLLEKIDVKKKVIQALVLCPTRELAIQVAEELSGLSKYKKGLHILPVYGGQPIERQLRSLDRGVHVIVGTPGRVMDHLERGTISFQDTSIVVLDEADEMFDMGFRGDIELILSKTPLDSQKVFFSATMPSPIMDLARSFLKSPEIIRVTPKNVTVPAVEQVYYEMKSYQKQDATCRIIDVYNPRRCIIFCSTKRGVDDLTVALQNRGYSSDALHGNLSQAQRDRVMNRFKQGSADILVATDVAARGIDVDEIDLVINFDIPNDAEIYVHRIGRTGRAGRTGKACTFITQRDYYKLRDIKHHTKAVITEGVIPSFKEVKSTKTLQIIEKVKKIIEEDALSEYAEMITTLLSEETTPLSIAAAFLKLCLQNELGEDLSTNQRDNFLTQNKERKPRDLRSSKFNKDSRRRNSTEKRKYPDEKKEGRIFKNNSNMVRLYFNIGKKRKITPKDILGAITGETNISGSAIGAIDIHENYSFVEVSKDVAEFVLEIMNGNTIRGYTLSVQKCK